MIVVITDEAEADLERIGDIIAAANPMRAISFVRELRQCCEGLSNMPERFQLVPRRPHGAVSSPCAWQLPDFLSGRDRNG